MDIYIQHEHMSANGCRNASQSAVNGGCAGIYNADGYGIADIDRLARIDGDGDLGFVHPQIECNDDPRAHATTDAEWRSLIRLLNAAPEMLAVLKSIRDDLGCGEGVSAAEADVMRCSIVAVLAKVEVAPPCNVTRRVSVTVEVEVETAPGEASEPGNVIMAAVEAVRDGEVTVVAHQIV